MKVAPHISEGPSPWPTPVNLEAWGGAPIRSPKRILCKPGASCGASRFARTPPQHDGSRTVDPQVQNRTEQKVLGHPRARVHTDRHTESSSHCLFCSPTPPGAPPPTPALHLAFFSRGTFHPPSSRAGQPSLCTSSHTPSVPQVRHLAARLSADLRVPVATPRLRLAPEHAYPAPLDDLAAAYDFLSTHGEHENTNIRLYEYTNIRTNILLY